MERMFKMIVHVPVENAEALRQAVDNAGGGKVGNYSHCSFTMRGIGRFRPLAGANPHIGEVGAMEEVEEEVVEFGWIAQSVLAEVVRVAREVHSYEEPAIEVLEVVQV